MKRKKTQRGGGSAFLGGIMKERPVKVLGNVLAYSSGAFIVLLFARGFINDLGLRFWLEAFMALVFCAAVLCLGALIVLGTVGVFLLKKFYPVLALLVMLPALLWMGYFVLDIWVLKRAADFPAMLKKEYATAAGPLSIDRVKTAGRYKALEFTVGVERFRLHPYYLSRMEGAKKLKVWYLPASRYIVKFQSED